jgi:hypothetical protein
MLGTAEATLFQTMAAELFNGRGTIVDAGSFLGKSAFHLASGMCASPHFVAGRDKVHCFDLFRVVHYTTIAFFRDRLGLQVGHGASTREVFERQVAPVREHLEVHEGDLHTIAWRREPITILMIDVAKSVGLSSRAIELFFKDLVPGASWVIHQDYHLPWHPYIAVVMSYLAPWFDLVAERVDSSAVFFLKAPIPEQELARAIRYEFSLLLADLILRSETEGFAAVLPDAEAFAAESAQLVQSDSVFARDLNGVLDNLLLNDGWHQLRSGRPDLALLRGDALLARNNMFAQSVRGFALRALARLEDAERALRVATAGDCYTGFAVIELAKVLDAAGRPDEAVAELGRAIGNPAAVDVEPRHYFDALGVIFTGQKRLEWCRGVMAGLRVAFDRHPEFWALDALVRSHSGDSQGAAGSLATAVAHGLTESRQREVKKQFAAPER